MQALPLTQNPMNLNLTAEEKKKALDTHFLPKRMQEKLAEELPAAALSTRFDGLSSIKPIYVTERLNEVFGHGGWRKTYLCDGSNNHYQVFTVGQTPSSRKDTEGNDGAVGHIVVGIEFVVFPFHYEENGALYRFTGITVDGYAGNTNKDIGDMLKGATSDALGKLCAEHLDLGAYVYKGLAKGGASKPTYVKQPEKVQPVRISIPTLGDTPSCPKCHGETSFVQGGTARATGKPYDAFYACKDRSCRGSVKA